jgi:putative transposase
MPSIKRYKYRALPDQGQERDLARLFGCCRYVHNRFIASRETMRRRHGVAPSFSQLSHDMTLLKSEPGYRWLNDVSVVPLQQALRHAQAAYRNYFASLKGERKGRRVGRPAYWKRTGTQSADFTLNSHFRLRHPDGCKWAFLALPKIGEIKLRWTRDLPTAPKTVTIILRPNGRYEASFTTLAPDHDAPKALHEACGVDVGVASFAVIQRSDGTGETIENPRFLKRKERKLKRLDRRLSHSKRSSRNHEKRRTRRARAYQQVKDARLDYLTRNARRLIDENQAIALETLSISGLARTRMGKSVLDAGWGRFIQLLTQMGAEAGRDIRRISQWEPTSQTCCVCHVKDGRKPLYIRSWTCPNCGAILDRDANAAVNIMLAAGLAESLNACGGDMNRRLARPAATSAPTKQEPAETIPLH